MRYGYGYGLDVKNGFRFFLTQVPGYSADYDKTRGDSVFVDNANNTMEVNNLQEGLTPTQYHGQKASVLDGTSQYWSKALPQDIAAFNPANANGDWTKYGTYTLDSNVLNEAGSATCIRIIATQSNHGIYKTSIITVGKKYKFKIRYKSTVDIRVGNSQVFNAYPSLYLSSTSQWNTVEKTFIAITENQVWITATGAGTILIDSISITEDWKLDLNESYELIKHSINRDFEQILGAELWTNTTFADSNSDGLADGFSHYNAKTTEVDTIETDGDGKHQKIVTSTDTRMLIKPSNLSNSSMYTVAISYKSTGTIDFWVGSVNGGAYTKYTLPASATKKTVSFDNYLDGRINSGIWFDMSNRTFQIYSISIREIPSLVTNGLFATDSAGWSLGSWSRNAGGYVEINTTSVQNFFQSYNFIVGKRYRVTFEIKNYVSGTVGYKANNVAPTTFFNSNGVKSFDWTQTTSYNYITFETGATFNGAIDNIHIYEISDYAPSVYAQVAGNNHYCQISSLDKQGSTGTQSLRITAGGAGRGAEVLTNGDITGSATGWNINGTTCQYGTNNFICTNVDNASACNNNVDLVIGKTYEVIYTITRTAGSIKVRLGTGNTGTTRAASGTYREVQTCATTTKLFFDGTGFSGTIESVSVKEVLGEVSLPSAQIDTLVSGNKYTKEFWAKLDPASLAYGSNLITSWVDSNANGVIDIVNNNNPTYFAGIAPSIKTAGTDGFTGIAQRIELASGGGLNIWLNGIIPNTRVYKVVFKYRSSKSVTVQQGGNVVATLGANTGNAIESTAYIPQVLGNESSIRFISATSTVGDYLEIGDISLYEATPIAITSQIGTKPVTIAPSISIYTKVVLNFEATASEVGQDIKFYLNGAGSVFIDNLSITQAYDVATAMTHKYTDVNKVSDMNSYNGHGFILRAGSFIVRDIVTTVISSAAINSAINIWETAIGIWNRSNSLTAYKNGTLQNTDTDFNKIGKMIIQTPFAIGNNVSTSNRTQGIISQSQIIRFTNISQSNFNPNTYKPGDAITGGGVEIVLWQDWSNVSGGIANDKYRPETTVRNDLVAYGSPLASDNIVTVKDYSPQTKKLVQGTKTKQPAYSSTDGFDFDGTADILEAPQTLGNIKTIILKLKADNLELAQDILQLNGSAKLALGTDGVLTATGWTSPTIKIQTTLLADSATIAANTEYLIAVKSATAIDATAFKLGGSTSFFNGKIKKVTVFNTTLDDPTIQKIFKSIRSI